jgi:ketosteroid isomerase-like protein
MEIALAKQIDPATERRGRDISASEELGRKYRALTAGNVVAARALMSDDAILRIPGRSQIAGTYHGPEAIAGYFQSLKDLSAGTAVVTVTDMTQAAGKAVVLQSVTAERSGRRLDDEQSAVLTLESGRVVDMIVHPRDLRAHDSFWGRASLLTPEDRDLLAAAIRAGSAPAPDPNARKRVMAWFVLAVIVFLLSIVAYNWLNTHYSRQRLLATTTDLPSVDHVVLTDESDEGSWRLEPVAVTQASIKPELGQVTVALPIPSAQCNELAARLGMTCEEGIVTAEPPFSFSWSEPARLTGGAQQTSRLDLDLRSAREGRPVSQMSLVTISRASPDLCFTEPAQPAELTLSDGERRAKFQVRPQAIPLGCDDGVVLSIGDGRGADQGTSIDLGGLTEAEFDATGTFMDVDGLAGRLALLNVERHVFDNAAHVVANASPGDPFLTEIDIGETESRLTVHSDEVTSVLTDDGELLPTEWERLPQPLVALIGSLATALVLPALIAFLQLWRDRLLLGRRQPQ